MQTDTLLPSAGLKDESQLVTFLLKDENSASTSCPYGNHSPPQDGESPPHSGLYGRHRQLARSGAAGHRHAHALRHGSAPETDRTRVLVIDIDGSKPGFASTG